MFKGLKEYIRDKWWLLVITGVLFVLFGLVTLFMPDVTLSTLITIFAVFVIIDGLITVVEGLGAIKIDKSWWLSVLLGILFVGAGIFLIQNPSLSVITFVTIIGWILIIHGVIYTLAGVLIPIDRIRWIMMGVLSILAGIIIRLYPEDSTLAFTWVLGIYAIINGIIILSSAFTIRTVYREITKEVKELEEK